MNCFYKNFDFLSIRKPSSYINGEWNTTLKSPLNASVRLLLAFPDTYDMGMSYYGFNILYEITDRLKDVYVDRIYAPWIDYENFLRQKKIQLKSLQSQSPLSEFDIIGFTLQYELNYTNILAILDLSGIKLKASDRDAVFPIVIGGGEGALSPEPLAAFFDAFVLGDGEEVLPEILDAIKNFKNQNGFFNKSRKIDLLETLMKIEGVYIPQFYKENYNESGKYLGLSPIHPSAPQKINKRIFNFQSTQGTIKPIVPLIPVTHDRFNVEIKRGCGGGCRFCRAGMIGRPIRERSPEDIIEICKAGLKNSGYDEVGLLSLSSTNHSQIDKIVDEFLNNFKDSGISLSLPSLRIDATDVELISKLGVGRKTGLTFAPEAGSARLRKIINKIISDEEIFSVIKFVLKRGWQTIKLYFMIGLPSETDDDIFAIVDLLNDVLKLGKQFQGKRFQLNVTLSPFVPKPHTPFQWESFLSEIELKRRIDIIRKNCRSSQISIKYHNLKQSLLESIISRGERRISYVIEKAFELGARFDAWDECFRFDIWEMAFKEYGYSIENFARSKFNLDDPLPWDFVSGIASKDFLKSEYHKALEEKTTPPCDTKKCVNCGVCFDNSKSKIQDVKNSNTQHFESAISLQDKCPENKILKERDIEFKHLSSQIYGEPVSKIRFRYTKREMAKFFSHLDIIRIIKIIIRRAEIPFILTRGFNSQPKLQFSSPLVLGYESDGEIFDCFLYKKIPPSEFIETIKRLNKFAPKGICFNFLEELPISTPSPDVSSIEAKMEIILSPQVSESLRDECERLFSPALIDFNAKEEIIVIHPKFISPENSSPKKFIDLKKIISSPHIEKSKDGAIIFKFILALKQNFYLDPLLALSSFLKKSPPLSLGDGIQVIRREIILK